MKGETVKHWVLFLIANLFFVLPARVSRATHTVEAVHMNICGSQPNRCLTLIADSAEASHHTQSLLYLAHPRVRGLGMEQKQFSSALIDFTNAVILLRQRINGQFYGEWSINIDSLKVTFYPPRKGKQF